MSICADSSEFRAGKARVWYDPAYNGGCWTVTHFSASGCPCTYRARNYAEALSYARRQAERTRQVGGGSPCGVDSGIALR